MRTVAAALALAGVGLVLAGCDPNSDVGYVELKTVPAMTNVAQPPLYLDSVKLEPFRKGAAVLTHRVGTTRLATDGAGGQLVLCEIIVKKNRLTSVTVSILERPPRCQCRNVGTSRTCVS
jgi:hypothetical protein